MKTIPSSIIITGTGSYAPNKTVTNDDLAKIVETSDEWIRTRSGISERHFAAPDETPSDMAAAAAEAAIENAGIARDEIDLLIVATMTPDHPFPSTACLVQSKLGLQQITAFDIQAACSGYVYALNIASNMLRSGAYRRALIIGAEKMSAILDFQDRTTCVLFGDGAAAAVLEASDIPTVGILDNLGGADGSNPELLYQPAGGSARPANKKTVADREHYLRMNGKEVFKLAVRVMGQACTDLLDRNDYSIDQIDCVIPHQANMRIIESLAKRLDLSMSKFHNNLDRYGNTSAASIGIALDEANRAGRLKPGDNLLLVAFGAGLTWGSTLIKWH